MEKPVSGSYAALVQRAQEEQLSGYQQAVQNKWKTILQSMELYGLVADLAPMGSRDITFAPSPGPFFFDLADKAGTELVCSAPLNLTVPYRMVLITGIMGEAPKPKPRTVEYITTTRSRAMRDARDGWNAAQRASGRPLPKPREMLETVVGKRLESNGAPGITTAKREWFGRSELTCCSGCGYHVCSCPPKPEVSSDGYARTDGRNYRFPVVAKYEHGQTSPAPLAAESFSEAIQRQTRQLREAQATRPPKHPPPLVRGSLEYHYEPAVPPGVAGYQADQRRVLVNAETYAQIEREIAAEKSELVSQYLGKLGDFSDPPKTPMRKAADDHRRHVDAHNAAAHEFYLKANGFKPPT